MGDQPVLVDDEYLHTAWPRKYENTENVTKNSNGHYVNEGDGHIVSNEYAYVNRNTSADYPGEGGASRYTYVDVPINSQESQVSDDHRTYLELINSGGDRGPLPVPLGRAVAGNENGKGKDEREKSSCGIFKTNRRVVIGLIVGAFAVLLLIVVIGLAVGLGTRLRDVSENNFESTTVEPATIVPQGGICVLGPYGQPGSRSENDNFSDEEFAANRTPSAFQFWTSANDILALRVRYEDDWGDIHGYDGAVPPNTAPFTSVVQILNPGEWVEDVYVGSDYHMGLVPAGIYTVVQLQLVTNQRALPQVSYGAKDVEMASGKKLSFVSGWSGLAIDVIKFHFLSC